MAAFITLKDIRDCWNHPELKSMDKVRFCAAILPDSFDCTCSAQPDLYSYLNMPERTMAKFFNGNRHDRESIYFAHAGLTRELMMEIRFDRPVIYQDEKRKCHSRKSMIDKLERWVNQTIPKMDGSHALFTALPLVNMDDLPVSDQGYFKPLVECIETLRKINTSRSLAYALFLMILTAIFHHSMPSLPELYSPQVIADMTTAASSELGEDFTDPGYMGNYHVYIHRSASNRLFQNGELSLHPDPNGGCKAKLSFLATDESPDSPYPPVHYTFEGKAMYNDRDKMIYIPMKDQFNSLGVLVFHYEKFITGPMYYRTGLFLSSAARTKLPQVRRIAICARELESREIAYVQGVLKSGGQQLVLTDRQLEDFCTLFRDYPWMEEFRHVFLPFIRSHVCYCLDEAELLANSTSRLDELDRMKMMLALKSMMNWKSFNRVDTSEPADLHKIMR